MKTFMLVGQALASKSALKIFDLCGKNSFFVIRI